MDPGPGAAVALISRLFRALFSIQHDRHMQWQTRADKFAPSGPATGASEVEHLGLAILAFAVFSLSLWTAK